MLSRRKLTLMLLGTLAIGVFGAPCQTGVGGFSMGPRVADAKDGGKGQSGDKGNNGKGDGDNGSEGDGSGEGDGGSKGDGGSEGDGGSKGGGGKGKGDDAGTDDGEDAGRNDNDVTDDDSAGDTTGAGSPTADLEVQHPDGMSERIESGRYVMKDSKGRTIINRRATKADRTRLRVISN